MPVFPQGFHQAHQQSQKYPWDEMVLLPGQSIPTRVFVPNQCLRKQTEHQGSKAMQHKTDADSSAKELQPKLLNKSGSG